MKNINMNNKRKMKKKKKKIQKLNGAGTLISDF
jgi:hypothetical protein